MTDDAERLDTPVDPELDTERERIDIDALIASCGRLHAGFDPVAIGKSLKMSDQAIRMGVGLLNGMTAVAAYMAAGGEGDPKSNVFRSKASKAARTKQMLRFLATAKEHKPNSKPLTGQEKLAILAELTRIKNPSIQVRAALAHSQLEAELQRRGEEDDERDSRPDKWIAGYLKLLPEPFCFAMAGLYSFWLPRKFGKGTEAFLIGPLQDDLLPHLKHHFPDLLRALLDAAAHDWERQCLAKEAAGPRKSIEEILAAVEARGQRGKSVIQFVSDAVTEFRERGSKGGSNAE